MRTIRPLTPKEFSEATGGLISAYTAREKCRKGELQTVNGAQHPPYYILPAELARYRPVIDRFLVAV